MCRIAGIIHKNHPPTEEQIVLMRDAMQHGGPDDCGIYIDTERQLALGHRRLALIDLSPAGHQPMYSAANDIAIVFNGEIYNYSEIKDELQKKGYRFISSSDTEVIIYAYDCWGIQCFKKFNGMFALCLLDKSRNKLILARDHAGIKPLYYSISNSSFYFASEVKAFKTIQPNWQENKDWKKYFLLFGHLPEPHTTLENVFPLAKGTCMEIDIPTLQYSTTKFFTPYYNYTIHNEEEAIELVRKSLTKAVERHLISDAPIGLFLSGGLDSSLLTLIAQPFLGKKPAYSFYYFR
jgi:asparagine synthase (glutamine-hydrolysing)